MTLTTKTFVLVREWLLSLYARREADYYSRLNDDDEYLAAELRRINLLQHIVWFRESVLLHKQKTRSGHLLDRGGKGSGGMFGQDSNG